MRIAFNVAGSQDPTRPEYVVSDMMQPLPELDLILASFDTGRDAAGDVLPDELPVNDCPSSGQSRLSYPAVVHGEEGDGAAHHVASSHDSFPSGNENSAGGFRKRQTVSGFHPHLDKKSFHACKGLGRGRAARRGASVDTTSGYIYGRLGRGRAISYGPSSDLTECQPVFNCVGRGVHRSPPRDAVFSRPVLPGEGRGVQHGQSSDSAVGKTFFLVDNGLPVTRHTWRDVHHTPCSDMSLDQRTVQPEFQSRVNAAASEPDLWTDERRKVVASCSSRNQLDGRSHLSPAAASEHDLCSESDLQHGPRRIRNRVSHGSLARCILHLNNRRTADNRPPSDAGLSAGMSSDAVAGAGAADICGDLPMQRLTTVQLPEAWVDSGVGDVHGPAGAHVDPDVELMRFESPVG